MKVKIIKSFFAALILLFVLGCPTKPTPKNFTAYMMQGIGSQQILGKIFLKGNEYRMDFKVGRQEISVLVDRKSGKQKILSHSRKVAQEYLNNSPKSLNNNPFEYFNFLLENNSSRKKGSEGINGYECSKIEVYKEDEILAIAWISNKLNWPIKIELKEKPRKYVILHDIKEEPVEKSLFQVPTDYKFYPLPKDKKEKSDAKIKPKKLEELSPKRKAVVDKLKENGIEYTTREGTLVFRAFGSTALSNIFPGWHFFLIHREKESQPTSGKNSKMNAAISKDTKNVYILSRPETDTLLDSGLKMVQDQKIKLNNEKDVEELGKALFFLYFRGSKIEDVESLGEN
jgi:hypothetical protein